MMKEKKAATRERRKTETCNTFNTKEYSSHIKRAQIHKQTNQRERERESAYLALFSFMRSTCAGFSERRKERKVREKQLRISVKKR